MKRLPNGKKGKKKQGKKDRAILRAECEDIMPEKREFQRFEAGGAEKVTLVLKEQGTRQRRPSREKERDKPVWERRRHRYEEKNLGQMQRRAVLSRGRPGKSRSKTLKRRSHESEEKKHDSNIGKESELSVAEG